MSDHPTSISIADAPIVKGMLARGDRQHDIAAWFGVNAGRIADVKTGKKHKEIPAAPQHALPPPGPFSYFTDRPDMTLADQVRQALAALDLKWSRSQAIVRKELRDAEEERQKTRAEARQINENIERLLRQFVELQRQLRTIEVPVAPRLTRRKPTS